MALTTFISHIRKYTYQTGNPYLKLKALGTLTADIRCNDIFNSKKTGTTVYGIRELTIENRARRVFSLDLIWKFNEARSKYKGTGAGKSQKARM
ncbi:MAG: hypothetical protein MR724_04135 [Prevotella sp.]|nr:hypothetical protein [Prevotella sp.]